MQNDSIYKSLLLFFSKEKGFWLLFFRVFKKCLYFAFEFHGEWVAVAVHCFADGDFHPAFWDRVFDDVGFLDTVEHDANAALEQFFIEEGAFGVDGEVVWRAVAHRIFAIMRLSLVVQLAGGASLSATSGALAIVLPSSA